MATKQDTLVSLSSELSSELKKPVTRSIKNRVAYIVSHGASYASNGYAVRTQGVAKALNGHGFETLCIVRPGRPWELDEHAAVGAEVIVDGVKYIHTGKDVNFIASKAQQHLKQSVEYFRELFYVYRPEYVIAASDFKIGLPALVAAKQLGIPFFNEVRGFWEMSRVAREPEYEATNNYKRQIERDTYVAQQSTAVFTLCETMKKELTRRGIENKKIHLLPNGVSKLPEIREPNSELRNQLTIQPDDKVIGFIGSITAYEGLDVLMSACQRLVDNGQKIKLLLVGDDQPLDSKIGEKRNSFSSELNPWLIQVGRVPHERVGDYYSLVDAIVIPRKKLPVCETVPPMKAAEALAYGKRLVVSDVAPLVEFAEKYNGVTSFEAGSIENLAQILQQSLISSAPQPNPHLLFSAHIEPMVQVLKMKAERNNLANEPQAFTTLKSQGDIVKKINESVIRKKRVYGVTEYTFPAAGQRLVVEFEVVSEVPYAPNQVVAGIELKDSDGGWVESESYSVFNYSRSKKYGMYKYLSANSEGSKYILTLEVPDTASECVIKLGFRREVKGKLVREPLFSFYTGKLESDLENALLSRVKCETPEKVGKLLQGLLFNVSYATAVAKVIKPVPMTTKIAADAFWYLWHLTNDPALFDLARQRLVFQGRMYETKQLLNEWDASVNFKNGKSSARRVEDEIKLLESGMPMPEKRPAPAYVPTGNVLYLLHNRLPYNSGGYATRTHGLLTGIARNSDFKMHGVSRPGYPADHAKHISMPLPENIPRIDVVDGIEYFALDQKIRRSSLSMTEYIEAYAQEIEALAIEKKASIIHAAANFPNGLAASLAARRLGIKSVYEVRGLWEITRLSRQEGWDETDQFRFMAKMEAEACNAADAVITITEALKDLMVSRGVDGSKITVAPNCVHTDLFSPLEKDQKLAKELGISNEDIVIGYIGSIVNYEGLDDLLEALALLVQDGVTNFKFLLVGDGAVLDELKQQVVDLGLQSYVVITGRVPHEEVQRYYSLVDITPFPRKPYQVCEAVSPLKPFEAMASEKAVIVSSCAALTEIIEDGYNGLVFNKGNIASFKDKIADLILDEKLRNKLAINGRKWVTENRDWKNSALIVGEIYKKAVKEND